MHFINWSTWNSSQHYIVTTVIDTRAFMLVLHQSNHVNTIKSMFFCYHYISILMFVQVIVCSLSLPCMLKCSVLHVGVKMLYNTNL